jgi:ankyrin repeat protein
MSELANPPRHTDLHEAAVKGDVSTITHILSSGRGNEIVDVDQRGYTPLMWAAFHGHPEAVNALLQHMTSAGVNIIGNDGHTALKLTTVKSKGANTISREAKIGRRKCYELLKKHGAKEKAGIKRNKTLCVVM